MKPLFLGQTITEDWQPEKCTNALCVGNREPQMDGGKRYERLRTHMLHPVHGGQTKPRLRCRYLP